MSIDEQRKILLRRRYPNNEARARVMRSFDQRTSGETVVEPLAEALPGGVQVSKCFGGELPEVLADIKRRRRTVLACQMGRGNAEWEVIHQPGQWEQEEFKLVHSA